MNKTLVKICGVTNVEDARWAANFGADYIGLNFYKESPRKISLDKALEIVRSLPAFVKVVGVFVDPEFAELEKVIKKTHFSIIQLHGNELPDFLGKIKSNLNCEIWKAIRIENDKSLELICGYQKFADKILLDAFHDELKGGSGKSFDWEVALKAKELGLPIFLAGGLNPENVAEAVKKVQPQGVDVASGVEKEGHPRKKDLEKMKLFIERAKGYSSSSFS